MNPNKWPDDLAYELELSIYQNGVTLGISKFRQDHPEKSYNACYSKHLRYGHFTPKEDQTKKKNFICRIFDRIKKWIRKSS